MREILFRAKRADNGEWVYGSLIKRSIGSFIVDENNKCSLQCCREFDFSFSSKLVKSETVGQYTGLTDKNGKKIFEGDIIQSKSRGRKEVKVYRFLIEYGSYIPSEYCNEIYSQYETIGFYAFDGNCDYQLSNCPKAIEIIGNIHDNPELLEVHNG